MLKLATNGNMNMNTMYGILLTIQIVMMLNETGL